MAEAEKKKRSLARSNFTRNSKIFKNLIEEDAAPDLVTAQFQKLNVTWGPLANTHDKFIEAVPI